MNRNAPEEGIAHSTQTVPYTYYSNCIPGGIPGVIVHWHKEFEINYILKGRTLFLCGEERIHAGEGDLVIVCPNMLHGVFPDSEEDYEYDTLVFSSRLVGSSVNDRCSAEYIHPLMNGSKRLRPHVSSVSPRHPKIRSALESIFACAKEGSAKNDLLLKSEMFRLFWLLEQDGAFCTADTSEKLHDLRPALEYINSHFQEQLTVSGLAQLVNLSKSYFMNWFRRVTGITCVEYINKVRINAACEMLLSKKTPITEVAFACGFGNLSNFNRQFKRITDLTPREYRRAEQSSTEVTV